MGARIYGFGYDLIEHQKSAKPEARPMGDRDFEAVRMRGARSGFPRRSGTCNRVTAVANGAETGYLSNPLNQYTNIVGEAATLPTYDADGNMLTCSLPTGNWTLTWDAENRLVMVSNATTVVRNAYDHQSRRIRKEVSRRDAETQSWSVERVNTFLYDGWNVIREVSVRSSEVSTNYYTWGLDLSGTQQGAGGVGGLLAVRTVSSLSSELAVYFPTYDANGNVTAYLDATGGVAAAYAYGPFGGTMAQSGPMAGEFAYRFSTKRWDGETGMYDYGYRFYSPELGRWINRDPIGEKGIGNLFLFIANRPTGAVDPLGLDWKDPVIVRVLEYVGRTGFLDDPLYAELKVDADSGCGQGNCYRVFHIETYAHPTIKAYGWDDNAVDDVIRHEQRHVADFKTYGFLGYDQQLKADLVARKKCFKTQEAATACMNVYKSEVSYYYGLEYKFITVAHVDFDELPWNPFYWYQIIELQHEFDRAKRAMEQGLRCACSQ